MWKQICFLGRRRTIYFVINLKCILCFYHILPTRDKMQLYLFVQKYLYLNGKNI